MILIDELCDDWFSKELTGRDMSKLVPYYRVSTKRQGVSGLGLEAQQLAVAEFTRQGQHQVIASYQEVESGRRADRPELAKAILHAKRTKAVLVIAKLDRLARNVHFLSGLMESGVEFVCCDMPSANKLTLHILAAVAEDEARRISERTKAALTAFKARGGKLGTVANLTREAGRRGAQTNHAMARTAYAGLLPQLREWRKSGLSFARISERLNDSGQTTRSGCLWNPAQVRRALLLDCH
jgi:DNA invertase Pin-like site-specific DNA recombinase